MIGNIIIVFTIIALMVFGVKGIIDLDDLYKKRKEEKISLFIPSSEISSPLILSSIGGFLLLVSIFMEWINIEKQSISGIELATEGSDLISGLNTSLTILFAFSFFGVLILFFALSESRE